MVIEDPQVEDFREAARHLGVLVRRLGSGDPAVIRALRRMLDESHRRWEELFHEEEEESSASSPVR